MKKIEKTDEQLISQIIEKCKSYNAPPQCNIYNSGFGGYFNYGPPETQHTLIPLIYGYHHGKIYKAAPLFYLRSVGEGLVEFTLESCTYGLYGKTDYGKSIPLNFFDQIETTRYSEFSKEMIPVDDSYLLNKIPSSIQQKLYNCSFAYLEINHLQDMLPLLFNEWKKYVNCKIADLEADKNVKNNNWQVLGYV